MPAEPAENPADAERRAQVARADAENRIDGITREPRTDAVFKAYVAGEIAVNDIAPRLHTLLGL